MAHQLWLQRELTLTYSPDAAEDIVVGTGSDTAKRLAAGTNNHYLHLNASSGAVEWAAGGILSVVEDTTPQLGGDLDLNQKSITLDPTPSSDHTWNGLTASFTAGEGMTVGELCYLKSDGKMWQMDADAEATTKGMAAMATSTIDAEAAGVFLLRGFIRDDTWDWTIGGDLFASTTAGLPTQTAPSATADIVRIVGQAYNADIIYFNPDNTYIEVA